MRTLLPLNYGYNGVIYISWSGGKGNQIRDTIFVHKLRNNKHMVHRHIGKYANFGCKHDNQKLVRPMESIHWCYLQPQLLTLLIWFLQRLILQSVLHSGAQWTFLECQWIVDYCYILYITRNICIRNKTLDSFCYMFEEWMIYCCLNLMVNNQVTAQHHHFWQGLSQRLFIYLMGRIFLFLSYTFVVSKQLRSIYFDNIDIILKILGT